MITFLKKRFSLTDDGARGMLKAAVATFFMNVAYMLPMMIVLYFTDRALARAAGGNPIFYVGIIAAASVVMYILINISYCATYNETYKEAANLRLELADVIKRLPLSYFSKHDLADMSQTVMRDVSDIEHAMSHAVPQSIGLGAFTVVIGVMLIAGNALLGLAVIVPIIVSFLLIMLSKKLQVSETTKYYKILRENSDAFQQAIELHQEIKSFNQKERVEKDIVKKINNSEKIHIRSELAQAAPMLTSLSILRVSLGTTVFTGIVLYAAQRVELLYLFGYIIAAVRLTDSIAGLYENIAELMYLDARVRRISELRTAKVQEGVKTEFNKFDIELQNVEFSYTEGVKIIDGISFTAKQNEVTALVGPSGCGKTTVLRLMSRLYDYDGGKILIDGKDIKDVDTDSLFKNISIVFQDVTLFNMSVMENIRIGNKNASDADVIAAAKMANSDEFIEGLPDKYNTLIGENGSKLSGGERQRISIARAFLKNAPIIILDEISASLDVENEMKIQESLDKLIKGKTVVIISHRLKSIENVDKIVVMDKGKVDSIGTHEELLKKSALYRTMTEKFAQAEAYRY